MHVMGICYTQMMASLHTDLVCVCVCVCRGIVCIHAMGICYTQAMGSLHQDSVYVYVHVYVYVEGQFTYMVWVYAIHRRWVACI